MVLKPSVLSIAAPPPTPKRDLTDKIKEDNRSSLTAGAEDEVNRDELETLDMLLIKKPIKLLFHRELLSTYFNFN